MHRKLIALEKTRKTPEVNNRLKLSTKDNFYNPPTTAYDVVSPFENGTSAAIPFNRGLSSRQSNGRLRSSDRQQIEEKQFGIISGNGQLLTQRELAHSPSKLSNKMRATHTTASRGSENKTKRKHRIIHQLPQVNMVAPSNNHSQLALK